jgi:carnitine-CoA ligase
LTKSKRPRDIALVDELPRTSVGKIRKFLLNEAAARAARERLSSHRGAPS